MVDKNKVLFADIETHSADELWDMDPDEFFRLGQYAWGEGEVVLTISRQEMIDQIEASELVVFHNGISFDLTAIYGKDSIRPLELSLENRVLDTMVHANLVFPAPMTFETRSGHRYYDARKPEKAMKWLSLDNLCYQLGLSGKIGDLKELAKKYGGFGDIPVDDPEFVEYAIQDIMALRELSGTLNALTRRSGVSWSYIWREMQIVSIDAQNSRNGVLVDTALAQARVNELAQERDELMALLVEKYNFPTEGKSPWASAAGKDAIIRILADHGITEETRPDWPRTPKGALKLGGSELIALTEGTEAEDVGRALATLKGQRSLAQLALDSTHADGRAHPSITRYQLSGRACIPETHRLLTRRGVLHIDEVIPGVDETLDMRNRWVRVLDVHRYADAEVHRYENKTSFIESTPEHRWVLRTDAGTRTLEPISDKRRTIQLAPDSYPFDPYEMDLWSHMSDREYVAALVGFLVTDGHASNRSDCKAGRFIVYQTEDKFYHKIKGFLGDLVTNDYSRPVPKHPSNVIHEMRLDTNRVSEMLLKEGLDWDGGLRNNQSLLPWVLSLSKSEIEAFLTAVYISDGGLRSGTPAVYNLNPNKTKAIQIAGYRMGRRTTYRVYENPDNYQTSGVISFQRDRVSTRNLGTPTKYTTDVWCVTTETGTFTAWYPDGRWSGPYLTGNSVAKPGMTVWTTRGPGAVEKAYFVADEGCVLLEADLSNADARAVAAFSGDTEFAKRFEPGVDGHELSGRLAFGDSVYDSDPKKYRQQAKAMSHGWNYSAGWRAISRASGLDEATAKNFVSKMNEAYAGVVYWREELSEEGKSGRIRNWWGRVMPVDKDRAYTQSSALIGQSATREVICDALLNIAHDNPEYIRWLRFQVHDALVWNIPEEETWWAVDYLVDAMDQTIDPEGGLKMRFPADHGPLAKNWMEAGH